MPSTFVGFLISAMSWPLIWRVLALFPLALFIKAFSVGFKVSVETVGITFAVLISVWLMRAPVRDGIRVAKRMPTTGYPAERRGALIKTLVTCVMIYLASLLAGKLPS